MSSTGVSPYRDRTLEFRSLSETLQKIGGLASSNGSQTTPSTSKLPSTSYRSEFNKRASRIGLGVHETSLKISRLAKLAKRSSLFDDPIKEIQELTALIKDDITALNVAVSDLQTLQNLELADGNYSEDRVVHSTTVCDDLKNKLMGATKQFQDVLTTRTENIKAHENRKLIFSTNVARENPLSNPPKTVTEPPPWSNSSGSLQQSVSPPDGVQVGSQLRRRLATDNTPSHHMEMSMLQQVVPRQESYSQSRAVALQNVESTISELGGIFTHLATMVAQQGELAIRIDDNMEESLTNVESARSALLRHLNQISSNRWLMIKIFAILIFFLMVFIFFVV
ncbi:Syntaxin-31 [Camellia lanceoleosa]|uniref:Syntaxin-31 n=1 Tax=Camellia lanceoleosa TaxID=1840588 RepID=A0ACC0IUC4_9ERIC|nr:Syntaxin-31 [Camellia lanceoleosa]